MSVEEGLATVKHLQEVEWRQVMVPQLLRTLAAAIALSAWANIGPGTAALAEDTPNPVYCESGYGFTTTSNYTNYKDAAFRQSFVNQRSYAISGTATNTSSRTYTWSFSASVSASARLAIFAEVKGEVNGSVQTSSTAQYGSSVTFTIPAYDTVTAEYGDYIEYLYGKSYYVSSSCSVSQVVYGNFRAPYNGHYWRVY